MRVVMLCGQEREYSHEASDWVREFTHETGIEVEELDPDTIEGEHFASAHEFMQYPTVAVLGPDNQKIQAWSGKLPQFEEVTYTMRSV